MPGIPSFHRLVPITLAAAALLALLSAAPARRPDDPAPAKTDKPAAPDVPKVTSPNAVKPPAASTLKDLLTRPILDPKHTLGEIQTYTEARIPLMPKVSTIPEWEMHAARMRAQVLEKVVFRGQARAWRDAKCKVEWLDELPPEEGVRIRKLRYEAIPGLWIPALLYEPLKLADKTPAMLAVNGHDSAGKAAKYKQIRCINLARRGLRVLNVEWINMGQLGGPANNHYCLNQIDLLGASGVAPFYLSMSRGIDILLAQPQADPARLAVSGLSGGGWQTIFISALDTRVTLANPVAGYSSFRTRARHLEDLGDSEQTPNDMALYSDYAHFSAMLAPRALLLTYNAADNCCFGAGHALPPLLEAARPIFQLYGKPQNLQSHINADPGTHNFEIDNRQALYRMIGAHFYPDDATFNPVEIPCDAQIKTAEQLKIELPADNLDLNKIALKLLAELPAANPPKTREMIEKWQQNARNSLQITLNARHYDVRPTLAEESTLNGATVRRWKLNIGGPWTVPAIEIAPKDPKATLILLSDDGFASKIDQIGKLVASGNRVLAVDPFYIGQSKISDKDFLFALLLGAVGDRTLGIQASQVGAIARWLHQPERPPARIFAYGPRTGLIALAAAALETQGVGSLFLHESLPTLRQVIEKNTPITAGPEYFTFGLLEKMDVATLAGLIAPRSVTFENASERHREELAGLKGLYEAFGKSFDPLPAVPPKAPAPNPAQSPEGNELKAGKPD